MTDLVVELDSDSLDDFTDAFAGGDFYVPPGEALLEEVRRSEGGHFNVIHRDSALRADVYLAGDDPFHAWALGHRRRIEVEGLGIWLAPLEYVVVRKLEYFRASGSDRHMRDVAMMLRISGPLVDPVAHTPRAPAPYPGSSASSANLRNLLGGVPTSIIRHRPGNGPLPATPSRRAIQTRSAN